MHQVTDPGACCPRCRGKHIAGNCNHRWKQFYQWLNFPPSGCMYGGEEHTEGSSWFADSTPCMTCMCVDGVTTCSEVRCLSPCVNFISVPGECCPVCAGKNSKHQLHFSQFFQVAWWSYMIVFEQTVYLRAECTVQVTVSTQLMTPVRSALVRYDA